MPGADRLNDTQLHRHVQSPVWNRYEAQEEQGDCGDAWIYSNEFWKRVDRAREVLLWKFSRTVY